MISNTVRGLINLALSNLELESQVANRIDLVELKSVVTELKTILAE